MRLLIYALMIEFFFGLNGRQILIGEEPIRSILYYSAVFAVCCKGFYYLYLRIKSHKENGMTVWQAFLTEVRVFQAVDRLFGILLLSHVIWVFVLPYLQRQENPTAMWDAYINALPMVYTAIYFPAVYLIRIGKVNWKKYRKFLQDYRKC